MFLASLLVIHELNEGEADGGCHETEDDGARAPAGTREVDGAAQDTAQALIAARVSEETGRGRPRAASFA